MDRSALPSGALRGPYRALERYRSNAGSARRVFSSATRCNRRAQPQNAHATRTRSDDQQAEQKRENNYTRTASQAHDQREPPVGANGHSQLPSHAAAAANGAGTADDVRTRSPKEMFGNGSEEKQQTHRRNGSRPSAAAAAAVAPSRSTSGFSAGGGPDAFWAEVAAMVRALRLWGLTGLPIVASYGWLRLTGGGQAGWDRAHTSCARRLASALGRLGGFYAKVGQMLASRPDLVPFAYARELSPLQDSMQPMPGPDVRHIVEQELLNGEPLEQHFSEFSFKPIGSASVAQVHRARLRSGQEVAVKVQRPLMENVMMGDAANLVAVSKTLRGQLNVDYYRVFTEMANQLVQEFDFAIEAEAMDWTSSLLENEFPGGCPLRVPRSIPGLVSKRALCMTYVQGTPISRLGQNLSLRGLSWRNVAARVAGKRLLSALTDAYAVMLLREGRFHGDPHAGNLILDNDGAPGLVDFGQMKTLEDEMRKKIARIILEVRSCNDPTEDPESFSRLAVAAKDLGVEFKDGHDPDTVAAALALWLFDSTTTRLPGGYDAGEFSPNAPVVAVKTFPQELVFMGRATVLIRGLCNRLGIAWNLAEEWAPYAEEALGLRARASPRRYRGLMSVFRQNVLVRRARSIVRWLVSWPFLIARVVAVRCYLLCRRMIQLFHFMLGGNDNGAAGTESQSR